MFDVVTVGSATQDVFVKTDASRIFSMRGPNDRSEFLGLPYGAKVDLSEVLFMTGGGATNAAVSIARQGLTVAAACALGDDDEASKIRHRLERDGVDVSLTVTLLGQSTPYSVILTSFEGDRTVLVFRGASDHLDPKQLDLAGLSRTKWLYVTSLGKASARVYPPLFAAARAAGARIAFNPGSNTVSAGVQASAELLSGLDVLLVNREEALTFLGQDPALRRGAPEEEDALYTRLLLDLQARGVRLPVVTDGHRGSYALEGRRRVRCPAAKVEKVVSTLGAGDAFGSTLVAGLLRHQDLARAMREGALNAGNVVSVFGAKRGLLDGAELLRRAAAPCGPDESPRVTEL